ncbi:hypothetical protein P9222_31870 [Paenibacillus amylolyticus]|nr:hypothetical protein [Paenibacillus amylolyticus]WFR62683.1 hypothetical protein P9222_31870 [Paenibacillus amylolyticus]
MTQQIPEEELIQRIIAGEKQLFSVLVDRYKNKRGPTQFCRASFCMHQF